MVHGAEDHQEHIEDPSGRMWSHSLAASQPLHVHVHVPADRPYVLCSHPARSRTLGPLRLPPVGSYM